MAEWQGPATPAHTEVLLVCPTCDDVFVPQFYRDCPWCGFHFGTGLEPQIPGENLIDPRMVWLVILSSAAAVGYVWLWYI